MCYDSVIGVCWIKDVSMEVFLIVGLMGMLLLWCVVDKWFWLILVGV